MIALQTSALVVWNVGAHNPLGLLRSLAAARDPKQAAYGLATLAIGLMFIAAATMLIISTVAAVPHLFVPVELFTFLVAIGVDALVGNEVRRAARLFR